jgi:hypothetical protein
LGVACTVAFAEEVTVGGGVAAALASPDGELAVLESRFLLADNGKRTDQLVSALVQQFKGHAAAKALELKGGQKIGLDQVKAAVQLLEESQGPAEWKHRRYVLSFLCCACSVVEDPAAKIAIRDALDSEYKGGGR